MARRERPGVELSRIPEPIRSAIAPLAEVMERITGSAGSGVLKKLATSAGLSSDAGWREVGATNQPAFENTWANLATYQTVAFCRDENGTVRLRGVVNNANPLVAPSTIFTLPDGYRPTATIIQATTSNNAFGVVTVTAAGLVRVVVGNIADFSLDGITFLAADGAPNKIARAVNAVLAKVNEVLDRLQED